MVFFQSFAAWCLLRFLPGLASAWVLVFTSAWALEQLSKAGRSALDGVVYAGVGSGIVFAGLICLVASHAHAGSGVAWAAMGIAALLAAVLLWPMASTDITQTPVAPGAGGSMGATEFWRLVCCYGAFGLGYIIPATFLPVMAREAIADPTAFGWAWPIFGAAAAVSTFFAARLSQAIGARRVWAWGSLVMAAGVVAPLAVSGLPGIMLGALCVGGTFMVNTMAGMQEARRVAGTHARPVMAAMTSAFAAGQIVGPLLVSSIDGRGGLAAALIASAVLLCAAAGVLYATGSAREPQT
jgi:MFS family permease